jgi:hypothetical protein
MFSHHCQFHRRSGSPADASLAAPAAGAGRADRPRDARRSGFAVLIALSLMSFVLVIVLSLVLMATVETTNAANAKDRLLARENARLGMMIALGDLQKHAGPDQRVTARGDILGNGSVAASAKYWTGVWNSANPAAAPAWMVSGEQPDPSATLNDQNSVLVDLYDPNEYSPNLGLPGASRREIRVPRVLVESGSLAGQFAYWIKDEGLKASVGLPDRWFDLDVTNYENFFNDFNQASTWQRERVRKMTGSIFDLKSDLQALGIVSSVNPSLPSHSIDNPQNTADSGLLTYSNFAKALSLKELGLGDIALPPEYLEFRSPDFTSVNYFTLTNTLDGGLKQDLSHLKRVYDDLGGNLPSQGELDTIYNAPQWDYLTPEIFRFVNFFKEYRFDPSLPPPLVKPNVPENNSELLVAHSTAPVITELIWNAGLGARSLPGGIGGIPTNDIYLYFYAIGELLNPHGYDLGINNGSGAFPGDPSDVQLRITNLPAITISNQTTPSIPTTIDLSEFVIAVGLNSFNDHAAGYMRPNFAPTSSYPSAISGNTGVGVFAVKIGELATTPASVRDDFEVTFGTSDVKIELRESNTNAIQTASDRQQWGFFLTDTPKPPNVPRFSEGADPSEGPRTFQTITLKNWGGFEIFYEGGIEGGSGADNDRFRFVRGGTGMKRSGSGGALNDGDVNFGIRMKFAEEWNESAASELSQELSELFVKSDLRQAEIQIDMNDLFSGDGEFYDVFRPREMDRSEFVRTDDFYKGAEFGSDVANRIARHYEAPTQEPISVGVLNQLRFKGFPSFPLGNKVSERKAPFLPPGSESAGITGILPDKSLNNYFDRYFFSSLPEDVAQWDQNEPLPNTKIVFSAASRKIPESDVRANLESPKASRHLLVEGGLNVNSTSVKAWEALLNHRIIPRFVYTRSGNNPERVRQRQALGVQRAFYSRPFTGDNNIESRSPQYTFIRQPSSAFLSNGISQKGPHETFIQGIRELSAEQARDLSEAIVQEIKNFGARENRGFTSMTEFLNEGVLQKSIDSVESINSPGGKPIPVLAPAYFSSGMLLNTLSHYLFARSDTFKIRVVGNSLDPVSGDILGQAIVEATVQRLSQESFGTLEPTFKVTQIRWLR